MSKSPRISRWRRTEVVRLMKLAGWKARKTLQGHVIIQKGKKTITLGSDPLHKNAVKSIEKALGLHLEEVIRKQVGKATTKTQFQKRLQLAKQMDLVGFDIKTIKRKCGLGILYTRGFKMCELRTKRSNEYADELYRRKST